MPPQSLSCALVQPSQSSSPAAVHSPAVSVPPQSLSLALMQPSQSSSSAPPPQVPPTWQVSSSRHRSPVEQSLPTSGTGSPKQEPNPLQASSAVHGLASSQSVVEGAGAWSQLLVASSQEPT